MRAFEAGWTARGIIAALTEAAHIEPTVELAKHLERWWENFGRLHLYHDLALIEFSDDFALPELLAGTALSRHLLYRFSPRLIAVRPDSIEELFADLEARGHTPRRAHE
ncbi:MAG: hypothetical protein HY784_03020 [Chloroflexi bacterium]|nr:hypothetical protein [Chloroflexota bacterium]